MSENNYPVIKTSEEVKDLINQNLNRQRAQKIIDKINILEKQLEHYQKVSKRWKQVSKFIRVSNLVLTGIVSGTVATLGILTTAGIAFPVVVTAILGGYTVIQSSVLEGMNVGIIKRKKQRFSDKCNIFRNYIDKMHFYYEKARQDNVITLDELEGFNRIVVEFENTIANNQAASTEHEDVIDMISLRQMAEIEAKNEFATEMKVKLKNEAKKRLELTVVS